MFRKNGIKKNADNTRTTNAEGKTTLRNRRERVLTVVVFVGKITKNAAKTIRKTP
jgi:hypothetical protein